MLHTVERPMVPSSPVGSYECVCYCDCFRITTMAVGCETKRAGMLSILFCDLNVVIMLSTTADVSAPLFHSLIYFLPIGGENMSMQTAR